MKTNQINLRKIRMERGYTIKDVKNELKKQNYFCSTSTLYKWEQNVIFPNLEALTALSKVYNTNLLAMISNNERGTLLLSEIEIFFVTLFRRDKIFKKLVLTLIEFRLKSEVLPLKTKQGLLKEFEKLMSES